MRERWKKLAVILAVVAICCGIVLAALSAYGREQMSKVPGLTFEETLAYTTGDNDDAVITVGVVRDGQKSYTVYGKDGHVLDHVAHTYEIGSLTKTITAALVSRAASEGRLELDAPISDYLDLPEGNTYPTIAQLLTHTSGYKEHYFEWPMAGNFFTGRNSFFGVSKDSVLKKAGSLSLPGEHSWLYSNFGYAVLGLVLESVYGQEWPELVEDFLHEDLDLANTSVSDGSGDLGNYWDWSEEDAYLPAGSLVSNIDDMLEYAQMQLDASGSFATCHAPLARIGTKNEQYELMDINMDSIGMAWIHDEKNGIVWHNGGTGNYNCYLGFIPKEGIAVVVLSNLSPSYRIPATVLGIKALQELGGA